MWGYRPGARPSDINQIREMVMQGCSSEQISHKLLIVEPCVRSFVEYFKKTKPVSEVALEVEVSDQQVAVTPPPRKRLTEKLEGQF